MKMIDLAPIEVEILLWRSRGFGSHKRLKRIAGLAPEKKWFYHRNRKRFIVPEDEQKISANPFNPHHPRANKKQLQKKACQQPTSFFIIPLIINIQNYTRFRTVNYFLESFKETFTYHWTSFTIRNIIILLFFRNR
jgi:hypothetical protein